MAMNKQTLAALMQQKVDALRGEKNPINYEAAFYLALASAIIEHIQSTAEVNGGTCSNGGPISGGKVS
jgi:hypothetical protein